MIIPVHRVQPQDVSRHYDEVDRFYRELWGEHLHHGLWITGRESPESAVQSLLNHVAEQAEIRPGLRICDVGCGYGAAARFLAETFGAQVTGYTISQKQFDIATSKSPVRGRCKYVLQDWMSNSLPDRSFDTIIAIESSEHLADKAGFFSQSHRLLRPGGKLAVCAWLADEKATPRQIKQLLEPICEEGRLPSMATASEYHSWAKAAGFEKIQHEDLSSKVQRTWKICTGRLVWHLLSRPSSWRLFFDSTLQNRRFAWTIFRIRKAYRESCLRYGLFLASKPGP